MAGPSPIALRGITKAVLRVRLPVKVGYDNGKDDLTLPVFERMKRFKPEPPPTSG
jgi:hypothetical protein